MGWSHRTSTRKHPASMRSKQETQGRSPKKSNIKPARNAMEEAPNRVTWEPQRGADGSWLDDRGRSKAPHQKGLCFILYRQGSWVGGGNASKKRKQGASKEDQPIIIKIDVDLIIIGATLSNVAPKRVISLKLRMIGWVRGR